jgi:hypothetical protein
MNREQDEWTATVDLSWQVLRFALMLVVLFWVLAFRLQPDAGGIPDFVYVNF